MADTAASAAPLLPRKKSAAQYTRCASHTGDELRSFRACLRWMCVDHTDRLRSAGSWAVFFLLAVAAPSAVTLGLPDSAPPRPFDGQVQISLTLAAALAYLSLASLLRVGLRRLLCIDGLRHDSDEVRVRYTAQLNRSFLVPCSIADAAYKVYWYWASAPFRSPWWNAAACAIDVASWVYFTAVFFMICVLFRVICYLQVLRMVGFAREFGRFADVAVVLEHHRRIRDQLRRISHRYRRSIIFCLVLVIASQFSALLATTRSHARINLATAGELADIRPKKMKDARLPPRVEVVRCWCGGPCKLKDVKDFSDKLGMKFFMCPNYEHDPPVARSPYDKPPSPPPLCMYYRWIDTEQPD